MSAVIAVLGGLLVALVATRLIEIAARRRAIFDAPNERSSHSVPTPRLGGVGIITGVTAALFLGGALGDARVLVVVVSATAVALVGLVDDLRPVPVTVKLAAQLIAAAVVMTIIAPTLAVVLPGIEPISLPGWLSWIVAVGWVVTVCNVVNFMDGIDALVASCVTIAALTVAFVGGWPALILLSVAAACLGFLVWNRPPASIFMGDSGSQYLGFILGAGMVLVAPASFVAYGPLVLAVLLFDVAFTLVRRIARGRNIVTAHREHLYQQLSDAWGHGRVTAIYALGTLVCAMAAHLYASTVALLELAALALIGGVLASIVLLAGRFRSM